MSAVTHFQAPTLRPMRESDVPVVMEIERHAYSHPWTPGIFRDCLRVGYNCWVMSDAQGLVGYGVMSVLAGECHILNVCIRPALQKRGYGRQLMQHLLGLAREYGASLALLEVRPSNVAAIRMYESMGFSEVGVRKAYYPAAHGREDGLILALELDA